MTKLSSDNNKQQSGDPIFRVSPNKMPVALDNDCCKLFSAMFFVLGTRHALLECIMGS